MPACVEGSWRVLDEAIGRMRRVVAHAAGRAESLVVRWCCPPPSQEFPDGSGCTNPLDLVVTVLNESERPGVALEWLCHQFGGHFVSEPGTAGEMFGACFGEMAPKVREVAGLMRKKKLTKEEAHRLGELANEVGASLVTYGREALTWRMEE